MRIGTPVMRSVVFCLWCVALLPGVSVGQGDAPVVIPTAVKAMLARLLPEPSEVQAAPAGEPKFFSTDLYRYIDGGADTYLDYGLVAMVHERYRASATDVTVDIYNLGAPSSRLWHLCFGKFAGLPLPAHRDGRLWHERNPQLLSGGVVR